MADYKASQSLRKTMEFAGFTYSERASSNNQLTFWRKEFHMPSGQPSVKAIAVVTAIASGRQKNVFMFQTQLALDESLIDPKFQIAMQQLTPEEYVLTIVPTLPALFELEDFYVRGNPHAGKKDVPNSASTLVQLLTGGQNER